MKIIELRCTYDPETLGGKAPDGRKVKGTIHWVSVADAVPVEVRLYDHLFFGRESLRYSGGRGLAGSSQSRFPQSAAAGMGRTESGRGGERGDLPV